VTLHFAVHLHDTPTITPAQVLPTVHIIGIRSKTKLPKAMLDKATNLMAIGCFCIGTDTTDLPVASMAGIPVFNSPFVPVFPPTVTLGLFWGSLQYKN
jgi:phosphoglycerate dehydrogenase-like enzyme